MVLFQAEIRPDMHGCNELRFNVTADSIQAIFKTYPAGKTLFTSYLVLYSGLVNPV